MSEDCHDSNNSSEDETRERAESLSCFDLGYISRRVKAYAAIIEIRRAEMRGEPMAAPEPDFLEYSEADLQFLRSMRIKGN